MILIWLMLLLLLRAINAQLDDSDLVSFITVRAYTPPTFGIMQASLTQVQLPHIRALKFNITYHDPDLVSPGYWFVAPYTRIDQEPPTKKWEPCQIGPYIYDANGVGIFPKRNMGQKKKQMTYY